MKTNTQALQLYELLRARFPDYQRGQVDLAPTEQGSAFGDMLIKHAQVSFQVHPTQEKSIGIAVIPDGECAVYGEGPDEIFSTVEEAFDRIVHLINTGDRTKAPTDG